VRDHEAAEKVAETVPMIMGVVLEVPGYGVVMVVFRTAMIVAVVLGPGHGVDCLSGPPDPHDATHS